MNMKAVRFVETGKPAEVFDVQKPKAGPGQVLLKIAGAGVCHSDLHILDEPLGLPGPLRSRTPRSPRTTRSSKRCRC